MKKFLCALASLALLFPQASFALSDADYVNMKANSPAFSETNARLGNVWKEVKGRLDEQSKEMLLKDQRQWVKTGWDERAKELISDQNLNRTKAYTKAAQERIEYLNNFSGAAKKSSAPNSQAANSSTVTVEAEGSGTTKMEALQAAWVEAVRKAVGMFMTGKSEAINDELTEKIVIHSRGQVNSYKVLSENHTDTSWNITILANIDKDILKEMVASSQTKSLKFDGSNLAASAISSEAKNKSAKELVEEASGILSLDKILDFDTQIYTYKDKDGKPGVIGQDILKINLKKFQIQSEELENFISKIATNKQEVRLDEEIGSKVMAYLNKQNYDNHEMKKFLNSRDYYLIRLNGGSFPMPHRLSGFPIGKTPRDSICFFKNVATAMCYVLPHEVEEEFRKKIWKRYTLDFQFKIGEGMGATVINSKKLNVTYPAFPNYIAPVFCVGTYTRDESYFAVLEYFQFLNLSNEDLINNKEISSSYNLTINK